MKKITVALAVLLFVVPSVSSAAALTSQQSSSLIAVVQSSPGIPASAFVSLITSFSNITVNQATSLITVVQAAPGVPASAFVNLLTSFTVDAVAVQPATPTTVVPAVTIPVTPTQTNSQSTATTQTNQQTTNTNNPSSLSVTLGQVTTTMTSVHVEWDTNLPSDSKIFLTQGGSTQIIQSASGRSTHHIIDSTNLLPGTQYSYVIEAISASQSQKLNGSFLNSNDNLIFSASANKTSVMIGNNETVSVSINVKYLTKTLNGLVVSVSASDSTQNKTWTLGNYQSTTLSYQYIPTTTGQHTITVTTGGNTQSFTITATPYTDIPATVSLLAPQNGTTFMQPPQTSMIVANLSCSYGGNTDGSHAVNPSSLTYEIISTDFIKNDLPLTVQNTGNGCANIVLNSYPSKGGKFQLKITGLKFGKSGVESDAIGLPLTSVQYEVQDQNTIVLWNNNVLSQAATYQSPSSQIYNQYGQQINSAIIYVGSHSRATLQVNWVGSGAYNNLSYSYVPCSSNNSCNQEPLPTTGTTPDGGSFPITLTPGYSYAKINILTPSNGSSGNYVPINGVLNVTLFLQ